MENYHDVTLVEKGSEWRTIGYGVGVWKNGLEILKKLPLNQAFWDSGCAVKEGGALNRNAEIVRLESFEEINGMPWAISFEREIIHQAIHELLSSTIVKFNTTISSITQLTSGVETEFNDGTKNKFDIVVGADGIRSRVRDLIFGKNKLKSYGWNIWGAWIPARLSPFPGYFVMGGNGECLLGFPYHERQAIGLMYRSESVNWPTLPKNHEEILEKFPLIKEHIHELVFSIEDLPTMFNDKLQYAEMDQWYDKRVVLIGDARHGMSPLTGMGTSLALEDAYVLAEELNHDQAIPAALENFSVRRNRRLETIKPFRKIIEGVGMPKSPMREKIRDFALGHMPNAFPKRLFKKMFELKI